MAERELAGIAIDQVQTDREDDIDPDSQHHIEVVGVDETRMGHEREAKRHDDANGQEQFGVQLGHTFSTSLLPRIPEGLKSRMRMRMPNAIASRKLEKLLPPMNVSTTPRTSPPS